MPDKAPRDEAWVNPFGPLTTKAARAAKPSIQFRGVLDRETVNPMGKTVGEFVERTGARVKALTHTTTARYADGTYSAFDFARFCFIEMWRSDEMNLSRELAFHRSPALKEIAIAWSQAEGMAAAELSRKMVETLAAAGVSVVRENGNLFKAFPTKDAIVTRVNPKPYALLYTYSLIIALVCGTAGLPHILVRFYTNPDGVAAKRTTMWVMILIGVFYLFPPVFGVMGRNLLPDLYAGAGAKGTDKVVLELPRILNKQGSTQAGEKGSRGEKVQVGDVSSAPLPTSPFSSLETGDRQPKIPWGSILSGITCAGAFAAFMSTFSGLLVSMTDALAHDVYGRMLRPKSTPQQRMRAFRLCAVIIGAVAVVLGMQVEPFQINFMVGQAFAIAAASYFPLLFVSCWWRGLTMKGAATGMLTGGLCALVGITLTSFSDLGWVKLADFWPAHPLLRILCEQPAIWSVPLAIGLMVLVSKLTAGEVPADIRMKMLVLHAPERLGLKQEYIQEHQTR